MPAITAASSRCPAQSQFDWIVFQSICIACSLPRKLGAFRDNRRIFGAITVRGSRAAKRDHSNMSGRLYGLQTDAARGRE